MILTDQYIKKISDFLGDTQEGFTGYEIQQQLKELGIQVITGPSKRVMLYQSLRDWAQNDEDIIRYIEFVMKPILFVGKKDRFDRYRKNINSVLAFVGYELSEEGKIHPILPVSTLTESELRANKLYSTLQSRNIHSDVLKYCRAELLQDNYFHAVLEATKGVMDRIRGIIHSSNDGAALVEEAFSGESPKLLINKRISMSEKSEQTGFAFLLKGILGFFRNPTAHEPKIDGHLSEEDAIDFFTLVSFIHRRLDKVILPPSIP